MYSVSKLPLDFVARFLKEGGGQMILWPLFGQLGPWPPGPPLCAPMIEFLLANWIWSPIKLITILLIR